MRFATASRPILCMEVIEELVHLLLSYSEDTVVLSAQTRETHRG